MVAIGKISLMILSLSIYGIYIYISGTLSFPQRQTKSLWHKKCQDKWKRFIPKFYFRVLMIKLSSSAGQVDLDTHRS